MYPEPGTKDRRAMNCQKYTWIYKLKSVMSTEPNRNVLFFYLLFYPSSVWTVAWQLLSEPDTEHHLPTKTASNTLLFLTRTDATAQHTTKLIYSGTHVPAAHLLVSTTKCSWENGNYCRSLVNMYDFPAHLYPSFHYYSSLWFISFSFPSLSPNIQSNV